jgi:hypothetical protein
MASAAAAAGATAAATAVTMTIITAATVATVVSTPIRSVWSVIVYGCSFSHNGALLFFSTIFLIRPL